MPEAEKQKKAYNKAVLIPTITSIFLLLVVLLLAYMLFNSQPVSLESNAMYYSYSEDMKLLGSGLNNRTVQFTYNIRSNDVNQELIEKNEKRIKDIMLTELLNHEADALMNSQGIKDYKANVIDEVYEVLGIKIEDIYFSSIIMN